MGFMSDMIVLATQDAGGGQGAGVTPGAPAVVEQHSTEKMTGSTGQVVGGVLEDDCRAIIQEFFRTRRAGPV